MFSVTIREKSGQVYTFHFDKPEIMIGRVKGNDVILPKQNISKRHALVRAQGPRFVVEDLGSTNGTYVNGHRIASPVEIGAEDKVYLGDFVMQYYDLGQPAEGAGGDIAAVEDELQSASDAVQAASAPLLPDDQLVADVGAAAGGGEADFDQGGFDADDFAGAAFDAGGFGDGGLGDGGFGDGGFGDELDLEAFDTEDPNKALESVDESTLSQLDQAARAAADEIEARRGAVAPEVVLGEAVASDDPLAAKGLDDRMTGPVHGLSEALDAVAQGEGLGVELQLSLPEEEEDRTHPPGSDAPLPTRQSDAVAAPSGHYDTLDMLYVEAVDALAEYLAGDAAQLNDSEWAEMEAQVVAFVDERASQGLSGGGDVERLKRDLIYELAGLGPLEALLDDDTIESIEVNGYDQLWLVRQGVRTASTLRFSNQQALTAAAERLVRASGVSADAAATWVDGTLADGTTIRVAWPPMCPEGPVVLVRKPRSDAPTLNELVERVVITAEAAEKLSALLMAGRSIALVGPAGAGRRTVLNALAREIPADERIVVAEQGVRLHLTQAQVVRLDASVGIERVLRIAHGLRPDRVLLGNCGGSEMMALVERTSDGFAPWMGLLFGHTADEAVERAVNAHRVAVPGAGAAVACARVATALDVLGVFSAAEGGPVLDHVVEVVRQGDELVTNTLDS